MIELEVDGEPSDGLGSLGGFLGEVALDGLRGLASVFPGEVLLGFSPLLLWKIFSKVV